MARIQKDYEHTFFSPIKQGAAKQKKENMYKCKYHNSLFFVFFYMGLQMQSIVIKAVVVFNTPARTDKYIHIHTHTQILYIFIYMYTYKCWKNVINNLRAYRSHVWNKKWRALTSIITYLLTLGRKSDLTTYDLELNVCFSSSSSSSNGLPQ